MHLMIYLKSSNTIPFVQIVSDDRLKVWEMENRWGSQIIRDQTYTWKRTLKRIESENRIFEESQTEEI